MQGNPSPTSTTPRLSLAARLSFLVILVDLLTSHSPFLGLGTGLAVRHEVYSYSLGAVLGVVNLVYWSDLSGFLQGPSTFALISLFLCLSGSGGHLVSG